MASDLECFVCLLNQYDFDDVAPFRGCEGAEPPGGEQSLSALARRGDAAALAASAFPLDDRFFALRSAERVPADLDLCYSTYDYWIMWLLNQENVR